MEDLLASRRYVVRALIDTTGPTTTPWLMGHELFKYLKRGLYSRIKADSSDIEDVYLHVVAGLSGFLYVIRS